MVEKLSAQQNVRLNNYLKAHPKTKKEDAIKLLFNFSQDNVQGSAIHENKPSVKQDIQLASGRKIVVKNGQARYYAADGTELNKKYFEQKEGRIELKPSGRYAVTKNGQTKYYAADGTELKASYFNQVEASDVRVKGKNGKTYNFNKTLEKRINNVAANIEKAENENGFIGKTWSGFKNLTGIGDSSDKVREQQANEKKLLAQFNSNTQNRAKIFEQLTGQKYTPENLEKFISGDIKLKSEISLAAYKEGQATAVDVGADIVSGVAAVGIYSAAVAAAPFTGGASIAVGVAAAGASGAAIKTGLKAADALTGGRSYSLNDAGHDSATGAFSGVLAPVTGGMGGAVGKSVATRFGIQAVKTAGKEAVSEAAKTGVKQGVKQTLKTALTNPAGYEYIGGNAAKRGVAMAAEMATDGALGGAADNAFRTSLDGGNLSEVAQSSLEGFIGGAIMSPIIGGGMKATGKAGHQVGTSLKGGKEVTADAVGASAAKSADAKPTDIKPAAVSPENANGVHTASSGKKAYQKPKLEVARFELQDDIMTGGTSASEGTKKTSFWSKLFGPKEKTIALGSSWTDFDTAQGKISIMVNKDGTVQGGGVGGSRNLQINKKLKPGEVMQLATTDNGQFLILERDMSGNYSVKRSNTPAPESQKPDVTVRRHAEKQPQLNRSNLNKHASSVQNKPATSSRSAAQTVRPQSTEIVGNSRLIGTVDSKQFYASVKGRNNNGGFIIEVNGKRYTTENYGAAIKLADGLEIQQQGNRVFGVFKPEIEATSTHGPKTGAVQSDTPTLTNKSVQNEVPQKPIQSEQPVQNDVKPAQVNDSNRATDFSQRPVEPAPKSVEQHKPTESMQMTPEPDPKPLTIKDKTYKGNKANELRDRAKAERDLRYDVDVLSDQIGKEQKSLNNIESSIRRAEEELKKFHSDYNSKYDQSLSDLREEGRTYRRDLTYFRSHLQELEKGLPDLESFTSTANRALHDLEIAAKNGKPVDLSNFMSFNNLSDNILEKHRLSTGANTGTMYDIAYLLHSYNFTMSKNKPKVLQEMREFVSKQVKRVENQEKQIEKCKQNIELANDKIVKNEQELHSLEIQKENGKQAPEYIAEYNRIQKQLKSLEVEQKNVTGKIEQLRNKRSQLYSQLSSMEEKDIYDGLPSDWIWNSNL